MAARPRGRDDVRAAVIASAKRRFAAGGPSASLRDIAADANVNLGLLHRHVGNKDDLIRAAFADAGQSGVTLLGTVDSLDDALGALVDRARSSDTEYPRMLAWMLLSGMQPQDLQEEFPTIARLVELAGPERRPVILLVLASLYGWQVFADQLVEALGYGLEHRRGAFDELAALLRRVVETELAAR